MLAVFRYKLHIIITPPASPRPAINTICCQDVWYQNSFYRLSPDVAQWMLSPSNEEIFQLRLGIKPEIHRPDHFTAADTMGVCDQFCDLSWQWCLWPRDIRDTDRVVWHWAQPLLCFAIISQSEASMGRCWPIRGQETEQSGAIKQYISIGLIVS